MAVTTTAIMREYLKEIVCQAKEIALLEEQNTLTAKNAAYWQQRAIDLGFQVDEAERKAEWARKLLERVEYYHDGLFAHTPEIGSLIMEIIEFLRPGSVPEWAKPKALVAV